MPAPIISPALLSIVRSAPEVENTLSSKDFPLMNLMSCIKDVSCALILDEGCCWLFTVSRLILFTWTSTPRMMFDRLSAAVQEVACWTTAPALLIDTKEIRSLARYVVVKLVWPLHETSVNVLPLDTTPRPSVILNVVFGVPTDRIPPEKHPVEDPDSTICACVRP